MCPGSKEEIQIQTYFEQDNLLVMYFIKNKSKSVMGEYGKAIRDVMRNPHPHISYANSTNDGQANSRIMFGVKSGRAKGVNHQTRLF